MIATSKPLIASLYEFLLMKGILNPDAYESLKFSGGSNDEGSRYVALIPYVFRHNRMYTVVLPYRRIESKAEDFEKPQDESAIEIIEREFFQETGLRFNKDQMVEILPRRRVSSDSSASGFHEQIFYSIRLAINLVQKMKLFKGPNNQDHEKAMPLFVQVSDIVELLATAHLVALRNLLVMFITKQDEIMLTDTKSENDLMQKHLRHLLELSEKEMALRNIKPEQQ